MPGLVDTHVHLEAESSPYIYKREGDLGSREGLINSREEARKAVRQRFKNGAHVIEITATGGVLSLAKSGKAPPLRIGEIEGVVS